MGRFITDIVSIPFSNNFSIIFFRYDCDDREAEDDELNGNDEDDEHEDKVGPQHALATLHHELTL